MKPGEMKIQRQKFNVEKKGLAGKHVRRNIADIS